MAIMVLSSQSDREIFDPVRKLWVAALPEELVRQRLLRSMLQHLGFSRAHIAVEKELRQLPGISPTHKLPERRVDVVCFSPEISVDKSLAPLLLIECKEKNARESAIEQLLGYNAYVQAPFIGLADEEGVRLAYNTEEGWEWIPFLPSYRELVNAVGRKAPSS